MRRFAIVVVMCAFAALLPSSASAQAWVGLGPSFAVSDYSDYANTGFLLVAGFGVPVGQEGLSVFGEGFFGQNSHETDGDKTNPYGVMGGVTLDLAEADEAGPYFFGQAGILVHKYGSDDFEGSSETGFGYGAGAGYHFPLGGMSAWVEGRAMSAGFDDGNTSFLGFLFGLSFPFASS